jgi:hypothetical protein
MVSHKYKTLFIHVPKAAGQSVEAFFLNLHGLKWEERLPLLLAPNAADKIGPPRLAHLHSVDYVRHHFVSQQDFDRYFKFGFVRNPWSRAVSFYKFHGHQHLMSFDKFVITKLPQLIQEQRWFYGPQYDFFYVNGENKADFIGKFESLQTDFAKVCKALNMPVQNLPHRNKSAQKGGISGLRKFGRRFVKQPESLLHLLFSRGDKIKSKNYRDYYTPGLIAAVEELYKEDVTAFEYSFED